MTYTEERARLLANIRAAISTGKYALSLCPTPGLTDFTVTHECLISDNKFIFHKREILE